MREKKEAGAESVGEKNYAELKLESPKNKRSKATKIEADVLDSKTETDSKTKDSKTADIEESKRADAKQKDSIKLIEFTTKNADAKNAPLDSQNAQTAQIPAAQIAALKISKDESHLKDKLQDALAGFIKHESFGGILLLLCVVVALLVANSTYAEHYFSFWHRELGLYFGTHLVGLSLLHLINDILMSLFFLMVGLEMKREMLYGELAGFKKVSFSVLAALGGLAAPIGIYLYFNHGTASAHGFGVPMSTDTAFALGVILLLGERIPKIIKIFLVTLAVADDLGAIAVIAIFYSENINFFWLYTSAVPFLILAYLNYRGTKYLNLYLIFGVVLWLCVYQTGIHVTVAAVVLALLIPGRTRITRKYFFEMMAEIDRLRSETADLRRHPKKPKIDKKSLGLAKYYWLRTSELWKASKTNIARFMKSENLGGDEKIDMARTSQIVYRLDAISKYSRFAQNPLLRLEHALQPLNAYFIVPLFAFANAGVAINGELNLTGDMIMLGTILGLVVGKPVGILAFAFLGAKLRLAHKPDELSYGHILAVGSISGIGFTMSMFVANIAFHDPAMVESSKIAILLASLISIILGSVLMLLFTKNHRH